MPLPKTRGPCGTCGRPFTAATMGRHLAACVGPGPALHVAMDVGPGTWWQHLALSPTATLRDLDHHLRDTWLECCDHMSAFGIDGTRYESRVEPDGYAWGPRPRSMSAKAAQVLLPGATFTHEYDFGSTTRLRGRVIGTIAPGKGKVTVLARNEPIAWPCGCGLPATRICPWCRSVACDGCAAPCPCDDFDEMALPVVNSPRMGVCGYGG